MSGDHSGGAAQHTELPRVHLSVDRWQAMMRGMWRLLAAGIAGGGCFVMLPNWGLLWQTQRASFIALATILVILGATTIGLAISAGRWLLVAMWGGPMGIEIGPEGIQLRLGPAGTHYFPWSELRFVLDEAVDWEMLDLMPDDVFVPRILHRGTRHGDSPPQSALAERGAVGRSRAGVDVGAMVVQYSAISHEEFTRHLRPYLSQIRRGERGLAGPEARGEA